MHAAWGQAKIEFIALRDEIFDEHQKGKSRNRIYLDLRSAGRITMSQRSFYSWFDTLSSSTSPKPPMINTGKSVKQLPVHTPLAVLQSAPPVSGKASATSAIEGRVETGRIQIWDDDPQENEPVRPEEVE